MVDNMASHLVKEAKQYQEQFKTGESAFIDEKKEALAQFIKLGLPNKKEEIWKYTNTSSFLKEDLKLNPPKGSWSHDIIKSFSLQETCNKIIFVNGHFNSDLTSLEDGLELKQDEHSSFFETEEPFDLFNKATSNSTIHLSVQADKVFENPIEILHLSSKENHNHINCPRIQIDVQNYSKIFVFEHFICTEKDKSPYYFVNALTEINCGEGSFVEHIKCQRDSLESVHIAQVKAKVQKDAHFKSFTLSLGASLARNNIFSYLENTWANTSVHGLFVIKEKQHCDNFSIINHKISHTTSEQLFKGVIDESAHGIFTGKVIVNPNAQQVNSTQLNNNLLLNKKAKVNTRPILEIDADDVKCSHGATIGQIDENQAFYLRTRGMSQRKAQEILCHAFLQEALDKITHEKIKDFVQPILVKRFEQFQILESNKEGEKNANRH